MSVTDKDQEAEYPIYGAEAYHILSHHWLRLGWNLGHWASLSWMGTRILQLPDDMIRLAELVWTMKPTVILETGVYEGGSSLYFASLCQLMGQGRVISVEYQLQPQAKADIEAGAFGLVTIIEGDSGAPETAATLRDQIGPDDRVLVFLDSDHSKTHVARELANLASFTSPDSYLIVADTNLASLADLPTGEACWTEDNPAAAVDEFLATHPEFRREHPAPKFQRAADFTQISYYGTSWLKRVG